MYRNPGVQDRFFFAGETRFEKDPAVLLEKVRGMDSASAQTVWLEGESDPAWTAELTQSGIYDSLPPAVIMDLDELVLDNSKLLGQLVLTGALRF